MTAPFNFSDDSSAYRSVDEVRYWDQKDHPITRFARYLMARGLWDEAKEKEWKETSRLGFCLIFVLLFSRLSGRFIECFFCRKEVMSAFSAAEKKLKPKVSEMFTDVYHDIPPHLQ